MPSHGKLGVAEALWCGDGGGVISSNGVPTAHRSTVARVRWFAAARGHPGRENMHAHICGICVELLAFRRARRSFLRVTLHHLMALD